MSANIPSSRIRVAIAGVGNCASCLVQGVEYYRDADPTEDVPGLMHVVLGGYHVRDVEFVAAFDVDADKVGLDLGKAIFAGQNNTIKFADVGRARRRGAARPDVRRLRQVLPRDGRGVARRAGRRRAGRCATRKADVLVSLPPGRLRGGAEASTPRPASTPASAFVNAIPVFIATDPEWAAKFEAAGVPIVGDDIKSQVGATIVHRILARLFEDRGIAHRPHVPAQLRRQHGLQEHAGAQAARSRRRSRRRSRSPARSTRASTTDNVHIGPSDHVPWLEDRKWAYIRLEGRNFGDVPLNIELKLEVWDSPNSAGVIIDAVRCAKLALDRGIGGPLARPVGLLHEVARRCSTTTTKPARWWSTSPTGSNRTPIRRADDAVSR